MGQRRVVFTRYHLLLPALFLASLVSLNIGFRYLGSGDTIPHELLPVSVIHEFDLDFNEFVDSTDPEELRYFYRNVDGRIVSIYPILPGLANVPVFFLAHLGSLDVYEYRHELSKITATVLVSLSVVFMFLIMAGLTRSNTIALLLSAVYLFGTCVWSVASMAMWQHTVSAPLLAAAFYCLLPGGRRQVAGRKSQVESRRSKGEDCGSAEKWKWLVPLAGWLLGLAVWGRPTNLVIAGPLALVVLFKHRRQFVSFAVGMAVPLVLMEVYSLVYWGDLLALGQGHRAGQFDGNPLHGFLGLMFSPNRGLLVFSPVLVFAVVELVRRTFAWRTDLTQRALGVSFLALVALYSFWGQWWGGYCFGYRLLLECIPILMVFMALAWNRTMAGNRPVMVLFGLLLAISVFFNFLGAVYYPQGFNMHPNSINLYPERLWDMADGELVRCAKKGWWRWTH